MPCCLPRVMVDIIRVDLAGLFDAPNQVGEDFLLHRRAAGRPQEQQIQMMMSAREFSARVTAVYEPFKPTALAEGRSEGVAKLVFPGTLVWSSSTTTCGKGLDNRAGRSEILA